jgi:signal peptidase
MSAETWRRPATWASRLLLLLVAGAMCFMIAVLIVVPRATHGVALTVLTGSMTPGIPVGSIVIDRPVDPGTLRVGDVATYQKTAGKAEFITHRIVAINNRTNPVTFIFKGDANRGPDTSPVPSTAIRGKVWFHVPYVGAFRDALHTKGGVEGVLMLLLAGYALMQAAGLLRDRRTHAHGPSSMASDWTEHCDSAVTVRAWLPPSALDKVSRREVVALLRGRLLEDNDDSYLVALDMPASEAEEFLGLFRQLGATTTEVSPISSPTPAIDRLRRDRPAGQQAAMSHA